MSVHKRGRKWVVRYDENGKQRQRTFDLRDHAQDFDTEVRRRKQLGTLATLTAPAQTLDDYVTDVWVPVHAPLLADRSRKVYAWAYDTHVSPALGAMPLHTITPAIVARWQAALVARKLSHETIRKARNVLSGILRTAVETELLGRNAVSAVRAPKAPLAPEVRPLAPVTVEAIRAVCGPRDASLISVLAYAGLRPQEARTLRWGHVGDRTLTVGSPKTRQRRSVRLLEPLAADLKAWRLRSGRPDQDAPVFPDSDGQEMTENNFTNWRATTWTNALDKAGIPYQRPYDLRHSFASLLLHEGRDVIYVARQLGHSATMTLQVYGHVIEELDGQPRVAADTVIRAARERDLRAGFAE
jgi:integrase